MSRIYTSLRALIGIGITFQTAFILNKSVRLHAQDKTTPPPNTTPADAALWNLPGASTPAPNVLTEATAKDIARRLGIQIDDLKKHYCQDFGAKVTGPLPVTSFDRKKSDLAYAKNLVNFIWETSQSTLSQEQPYDQSGPFFKAPKHKLHEGDTKEAFAPQTPEKWKIRTLARALLTPADLKKLTPSQGHTTQSDYDTLSILPDDIIYSLLAEKITERMKDPLPNAEEYRTRVGDSKPLPVYPTDTLRALPSRAADPLYTAQMRTAWERIAEIQSILDGSPRPFSNDKGKKTLPSPAEKEVLCNEYAALVARIQEGKFDQIVKDVSKRTLHDAPTRTLRDASPQVPGSHAIDRKADNWNLEKAAEAGVITKEDGEDAAKCFNETYMDLVVRRSEQLSKDPRFAGLFKDLGQKSTNQLLRLLEQSKQGPGLDLFLQELRMAREGPPEDKIEYDRPPMPVPDIFGGKVKGNHLPLRPQQKPTPGTVPRPAAAPFSVYDLDLTDLNQEGASDELKALSPLAQNALGGDHSASLFLFLGDFFPQAGKASGLSKDPATDIAVVNSSFNRFLKDRSASRRNNVVFLSAIYQALREHLPEARIEENDTSQEIQDKLMKLIRSGKPLNFGPVYQRLNAILAQYQSSDGKSDTPVSFGTAHDNKVFAKYHELEALRAYVHNSNNELEAQLKKCVESIASRRKLSPQQRGAIEHAMLEQLKLKSDQNEFTRNQKIVGQLDLSPEEAFSFLLAELPPNGSSLKESTNRDYHNMKLGQESHQNMVEAGKFFRENYDVKPLPEKDQIHGILDTSKVPLIGKMISQDPKSPHLQQEILTFLSPDVFQHHVSLFSEAEMSNLCKMYLPILTEDNLKLVDPSIKTICEQSYDATGANMPGRFYSGKSVVIPNGYDPQSKKIHDEVVALKAQISKVQAQRISGRQSLENSKKFHAAKAAKIKELESKISGKEAALEQMLSGNGQSRVPQIMSTEEYSKEVDKYEAKAEAILKKYTKELEDLDMFSGGQRDFWYNYMKGAFATVLAVPILASTSVVGLGADGLKAIKDMYKVDSKVLPKLLDMHERMINELFHMRLDLENRLGLTQSFTKDAQGQVVPVQDDERDRVFSYLQSAEQLFDNGFVKDKDGKDTKKAYGNFAEYNMGAKSSATELAITASTFGIGTGWNLAFRAGVRLTGVTAARTLAGRGFTRSAAQAWRSINPTNKVGNAFFKATLRRGIAQSTQVAVMNSAFPRTLPYALEHTPVTMQEWFYGAEIKKGAKHNKDYMRGMMEDPWFKFRTDAVYQLFTPAYVSMEARMNAAMMKNYSRAVAAAEASPGVGGTVLRSAFKVPTIVPVVAATTASNALSGIPVDAYVQYFDPISGTRKKFEEEIKNMDNNIEGIKEEIASGKLSPKAEAKQKEKLAIAEDEYRQKLKEPFNQIRSGFVMGGTMAWTMVKVGDPYEKVGIMMRQQNNMSEAKARSLLGIDATADVRTLSDLWRRTDQRMVAIWDEGKMMLPNKDAAGKFEKMLEAMAAYNKLKKMYQGGGSTRAPYDVQRLPPITPSGMPPPPRVPRFVVPPLPPQGP